MARRPPSSLGAKPPHRVPTRRSTPRWSRQRGGGGGGAKQGVLCQGPFFRKAESPQKRRGAGLHKARQDKRPDAQRTRATTSADLAVHASSWSAVPAEPRRACRAAPCLLSTRKHGLQRGQEPLRKLGHRCFSTPEGSETGIKQDNFLKFAHTGASQRSRCRFPYVPAHRLALAIQWANAWGDSSCRVRLRLPKPSMWLEKGRNTRNKDALGTWTGGRVGNSGIKEERGQERPSARTVQCLDLEPVVDRRTSGID